MTSLGWVHPNPAIQGNRIHLFVGTGTILAGTPELDEHESTEVVVVPAADALKKLRSGEIRHALSALAMERAFSTHPSLFGSLGKSAR